MSINKVILIGRLGQDPELKYTPSGLSVCNFSLATSESWKDKQTGQKQEKTEWHRVVVWGKLSELCNQYLSKGRQVYIEGKLQTRSWDDTKTGQKRYTTEVLASTVQFIDTQKGDSSGMSMGNNDDFGQRDDLSSSQGSSEGSSFNRQSGNSGNSGNPGQSNGNSNSYSNNSQNSQNFQNPQRGNEKSRDYNIPMDDHQFTSDDIPF